MQLRKNTRRRRRIDRRSPRVVLIRQICIGLLVLAFVSLGAYGVWHGTRIDSLTIETVHVTGGETVSHNAIQALVQDRLTGTYFLLVPRRFAWLYPEERIIEDITSHDRVAAVSIERTSGTELSIQVEEYRPNGLWCSLAGEAECVFVDETGYAFDASPALDGAAFLRYVDPTRTPTVGEYAYDADVASRITELSHELHERYAFDVLAIEQIAPDEVSYRLTNGASLKVTQTMSTDTLLANLDTILSSPEFRHLRTDPFVYIDLRYGDKVFVKESPTEEDAETEVGQPDEHIGTASSTTETQ